MCESGVHDVDPTPMHPTSTMQIPGFIAEPTGAAS
jgi:hypothetical protein